MNERPDLGVDRLIPDAPGAYGPGDPGRLHLSEKRPPRGVGAVVAIAGLCLLLGVVGGAVAANQASAPVAPITVAASPVVKTVTVTKAPAACVNAIAGVAKVSVRQFRIIDLYREALNHANVAAWNEADRLYFHMTDGTANVKHAANVCVKAAGG